VVCDAGALAPEPDPLSPEPAVPVPLPVPCGGGGGGVGFVPVPVPVGGGAVVFAVVVMSVGVVVVVGVVVSVVVSGLVTVVGIATGVVVDGSEVGAVGSTVASLWFWVRPAGVGLVLTDASDAVVVGSVGFAGAVEIAVSGLRNALVGGCCTGLVSFALTVLCNVGVERCWGVAEIGATAAAPGAGPAGWGTAATVVTWWVAWCEVLE